MRLSGLGKLLVGFILAIAVLVGGGVAVALYLISRVNTDPPKPIFANDQPPVKIQRPPSSNRAKSPSLATTQPSVNSTPSKTPSPESLEAGTYKARVTWPQGLSLRSEAGPDAERIGGVDYNQEIIVLEESADQKWQRVRLDGGEQEGWIKAGNIERVEEE